MENRGINPRLAVWGVSKKFGQQALAALVLLVLALGISACGGGDGESDEEKIEKTIEVAWTEPGPEACGESRTIAYMEDLSDAKGEEAEADCEESVADRENMPTAVAVSKIEVGDEGATAEVAMTGGEQDGLVVKMALVEEDGTWKIDEVVELVSLDRESFTGKIEDEFRKEGLEAPEIRCLVSKIDQFSQSDFEQLALGEDEAAVNRISVQCENSLEAEAEEEFEPATGAEEDLEEALSELEEESGSVEYPRSVQNNYLESCLATSGSNFAVCECSLAVLEENYSVGDIQQAEANIASGRMREMVETAILGCV